MREKPKPSPALVEILSQTGELDRILDGRGLTFDSTPAPPVTPPPSFFIPRPDWDAEQREREEQERQRQQEERAKILEEELTRLAAEDEEIYPAPPTKKRWRP